MCTESFSQNLVTTFGIKLAAYLLAVCLRHIQNLEFQLEYCSFTRVTHFCQKLSPSSVIGPCKLIWDYGITLERIGIMGLHPVWNYGITCLLKLGLRDYTPFEIGIMGLQDLPLQGPSHIHVLFFTKSSVRSLHLKTSLECRLWYWRWWVLHWVFYSRTSSQPWIRIWTDWLIIVAHSQFIVKQVSPFFLV